MRSSPRPRGGKLWEAWLLHLLQGAAWSSGVLLLLLLGSLAIESVEAIRVLRPGRLLGDPSWTPSESLYFLLPMVVGTLLVTTGGLLLAAPLALASACFSLYVASPRARWFHLRTLEAMAGIPGVVLGLWGLTRLVPLLQGLGVPGTSLFTAILLLAILLLPALSLSFEAALAAVPPEYPEASAALGMSPESTLLRVVLPAARGPLVTALVLQMGRALGETMAVLMVCGNVPRLPASLFSPVRTLTTNIALEMGYAMGEHRSALFVSGSALLALGVLATLVIHALEEEP